MTAATTSSPRRMPYHPPLVHVPIGATVTAAVLDVISAVSGAGHGSARDLYRAATWVLMVGMGVMFLAALAGLADRSRVTAHGPAARRAMIRHAGIMGSVMVLTIAELTLRRQHYPHAAATPAAVLVIEAVTVALTVVGTHAGGKLVHGDQSPDASGSVPAPTDSVGEPAAR